MNEDTKSAGDCVDQPGLRAWVQELMSREPYMSEELIAEHRAEGWRSYYHSLSREARQRYRNGMNDKAKNEVLAEIMARKPSPEQRAAMDRVQAWARKALPQDVSLVDDLIQERRAESARD